LRKPKPLISEAQAFRYALWLLGRRSYSGGELKDKFRLRSLVPSLQETVLQRLKERKFIDDWEFAEQFVHSKKAQGWGPRKILTALQKKRIPRDLMEKALNLRFPLEDEKEQAKELLSRQKQRFLHKKEKRAGDSRRKAFEFLVRKGYSLEIARLAVMNVFSYNSDLLNDQE
jgi:regulatory protein